MILWGNISGGSHPFVGITSKTHFKSLQESVCALDSCLIVDVHPLS